MRRWLLLVAWLVAFPLQAAIETHDFDSPAQEALYKRLIAELRCLVCQNQNIADSNAELAQDLRRKTYELVKQGKSETEITAFMVQRYGDFVLYQPPLNSHTALLWIGPFLILAIGVFVLLRLSRQRTAGEAKADLSEDQRQRAERLLKGETDD